MLHARLFVVGNKYPLQACSLRLVSHKEGIYSRSVGEYYIWAVGWHWIALDRFGRVDWWLGEFITNKLPRVKVKIYSSMSEGNKNVPMWLLGEPLHHVRSCSIPLSFSGHNTRELHTYQSLWCLSSDYYNYYYFYDDNNNCRWFGAPCSISRDYGANNLMQLVMDEVKICWCLKVDYVRASSSTMKIILTCGVVCQWLSCIRVNHESYQKKTTSSLGGFWGIICLRSECFQVQLVTYWHLSVSLCWNGV